MIAAFTLTFWKVTVYSLYYEELMTILMRQPELTAILCDYHQLGKFWKKSKLIVVIPLVQLR